MLSSRERVMAAVDRRVPDQAPTGLGEHRSSDMMADVLPEKIVAMLDAANA